MPLVRCPQCGRVADGRNCFACGYEWPRDGSASQAPQPSTQPPRAPTPAAPGPSPFAKPPGPSPFSSPPPGPSPFAKTPPPSPPSSPSPFSQPPQPSTSPFATTSRSSAGTLPPPPSPFATKPGSNPLFSGAPSSPPSTSPFAQPPPPPPPSFSMAPPSDFAMPPPPDEIVVDTDLSFSLAPNAMNPGIGSGRMPTPPGMRPPSMSPTPTPPPQPGGGRSGLDSLFDGVELALPRAAPAPMSDPALDAGDFMPKAAAPEPSSSSSSSGGGGLDDWGPTAAALDAGGDAGLGLGADLLAAFNASAVTEPEPNGAGLAIGGNVGGETDIAIDISMTSSVGNEFVVDVGDTLDERLRNLAERLRADGRPDDAELVTEALLALELR